MVQHFKLTLKFNGIPNDDIRDKEKFDNLLAAVITQYPLLVNDENAKKKTAEIKIENETVFLTINKGSEELIELDHIVEYFRYGVKTINEDPTNCIRLMKYPPGPNFEASLSKLRLADPDNAELDILADPPIRTNSTLVLWHLIDFPLQFMTEAQTVGLVSLIEREIGIKDDQLTLCSSLLAHLDMIKGNQGEMEKLQAKFKQFPESCLKDTITLYNSCRGTMHGLLIAFEAYFKTLGLNIDNELNMTLKISRLIQDIKKFGTEIFHEWKEGYKTIHAVVHNPHQYKDSLERTNGLSGITKTSKENILKMITLDLINPGDGIYLVRSKKGVGEYAHVAVVTDTKLMNFVHAVQNTTFRDRELGKIVEEHFDKVVKKEDECFILRHEKAELTGQDIAYRARTFANSLPVIKFTYDVVDANCEVVLNAAAGIFEKCLCSLQGRLVQEPHSGRGKKIAGLVLGQIQKSPKESELLDDLYYKLKKFGMLSASELRPGNQQVAMNINPTQEDPVSALFGRTDPKNPQQEQDSCSQDDISGGYSGNSACDMETDITLRASLEDLGLTAKGEPNKTSRRLTKEGKPMAIEKQLIEFDISFESIPNNMPNMNIFDKSPGQENASNGTEYQMKLEANHTFKDNVATSKKAKFILVVDKSGSMQGKPWQQVQAALNRILNLTRDTEVSCSVLTYNHDVIVLDLSGDEEADRENINNIRANGATDFVAVFEELGRIFREIKDTSAYHVFFMTDGNDTRNNMSAITKAKEELQVEIEKANTDITFHVVGFSAEHDSEFLDGLKIIGTQDGGYTYVSPSEEGEALQERIVQLVESTSSFLGRSVHIELACGDIEFLGDWFGRTKNEALWAALLTKKGGTTKITTNAFVKIRNMKEIKKSEISLNVYEKLRYDTKPIEGMVKNRQHKCLEKREEIEGHQLRKLRLAMNMITDKVSTENSELQEIKSWYKLVKAKVDEIKDVDKSNPTTKRILNNIERGIVLCDPVLETSLEGGEMEMKRLAIKNLYEIDSRTPPKHMGRMNEQSSEKCLQMEDSEPSTSKSRISIFQTLTSILWAPKKMIQRKTSPEENTKLKANSSEESESEFPEETTTCMSSYSRPNSEPSSDEEYEDVSDGSEEDKQEP